MSGRTLTRAELDALPLGERVGFTDGQGFPGAAVKVGTRPSSGAETFSITGPTLVSAFAIAQAAAVVLEPAAGPGPAAPQVQVLTAPADVDALPARAVIRDAAGNVAENAGGPYPWLTTGFSESWPSEAFTYPVTVLWPLPGADQ
ncbi:hypothetical protein [Cellulosimicrobium sp. 22601]|uniref:hypothetical protein n=1 Tax=unclassified Cellulosimicrobium TaxID=2624466 RepID=UPI003F86286A